ncbi:hypothetical protein WJX72_008452 [[Myrmecia] bisecta]|uniref:Uncharacterized protein n=1 Tax=[Myrmecia] bisecta TaxID=41462 RepID=A0AAW1PDF1_9CHLO
MGTVEGQPIFSQLLGNETHEHVGVARAFGIGNKLLIEQLTRLDPTEMILNWQLLSHPLNTNPWPSSFVNFKASLQVFPVLIPGGQSFINWSMELLTEQHAVGAMVKAMEDIQKLGLTNLQVYLAAGLRTPVTAPLAPASFHISQMMQPEQTLAAQQQSAGMGHLPVLPQNPIYCPPPGTPMLTPSAVQPVSSALTQTPEQQQQQASQNASLLQAQLAQLECPGPPEPVFAVCQPLFDNLEAAAHCMFCAAQK